MGCLMHTLLPYNHAYLMHHVQRASCYCELKMRRDLESAGWALFGYNDRLTVRYPIDSTHLINQQFDPNDFTASANDVLTN